MFPSESGEVSVLPEGEDSVPSPGMNRRTRFVRIAACVLMLAPGMCVGADEVRSSLCVESRNRPDVSESFIARQMERYGVELAGLSGSLRARYGARIAAVYDDKGMQFMIRIRDPDPMQNFADPAQPYDQAFLADALLLGLQAPDQPAVQLLSYYLTNRQRPVLRAWRANPAVPPESDAPTEISTESVRAEFRKDNNASSYLQVISVPWRFLGMQRPATGVKVTLDAFWGGDAARKSYPAQAFNFVDEGRPSGRFRWMNPSAWGRLELGCGSAPAAGRGSSSTPRQRLHDLRYATEGQIPISYELARDAAFVTLVVESLDGSRVRNLIGGFPRKAGRQIDYWDGKDDAGRAVEPGRYRVRGLFHSGLDAHYEFSFGAPGDPPWPTADGRGAWLANHTNPVAVLADPESERVYVAAVFSEGPHTLIAVDYAGRKLWGALARAHAGPMALHKGYLYVVSEEGLGPARKEEDIKASVQVRLVRLDPQTGQRIALQGTTTGRIIASWIPAKVGPSRLAEGETARNGFTADWAGAGVMGLAALDGFLYVPLRYENRILRVVPETGVVQGSISLPRPAGLVALRNKLLAVSDRRVVEIDPRTGSITTLIGSGLSAPVALATDAKGNIHVSDWADRMQVRVFSSTGEPRFDIGLVGGRSEAGPYDKNTMMFPRGLAVDRQGRLWVAEDDFSPRRLSIWNPDGKLADEILGGLHYGGAGAYVIPDQPDRAIVLGNRVELDWQRGRWRILDTLWRANDPRRLIGLSHDVRVGNVLRTAHGRFMIHSAGRGGVTVISRMDESAGRAVPVAAAGAVVQLLGSSGDAWKGGVAIPSLLAQHLWISPRVNSTANRVLPWFFEGPRAGGIEALYAGAAKVRAAAGVRDSSVYPDANFVWSDLNGNGYVDRDEIAFYASPGARRPAPAWRTNRWARGVADRDLTLYFTVDGRMEAEHWRLPVARWTDGGVPVYEPGKAARLTSTSNRGSVSWVDQDAKTILTMADTPNPGRNGKTDPLTMLAPGGSVLWTYPSPYSGVHASHAAPKPSPGLLVGALGVLGAAELENTGKIFALNTNMGEAVFFTHDGLYIGPVFSDTRSASASFPDKPRRGESLGGVSNGGEWFGGQLFQRSDNGQVYIVMGREAANIVRIAGLDRIRRLPDQVVTLGGHRKDGVAAGKSVTGDEATPVKDAPPALRISALQPQRNGRAGVLERWRSGFAAWQYDEMNRAEASWSWGDGNLYVRFRHVGDPSPMINTGDDIQQLFKPGDAVLFDLGTRPDRNGTTPAGGDIRLLFSVYRGEPVAVLYRYGASDRRNTRRFVSSAGTTVADVSRLDRAQVRFERDDAGYSMLATVPLADIAFTPHPGQAYRGDFGVVYADASGSDNMLRMFWANRRGGLTSDLAGEANIDPGRWGVFQVEPGNGER